jgi:hypothetical protein
MQFCPIIVNKYNGSWNNVKTSVNRQQTLLNIPHNFGFHIYIYIPALWSKGTSLNILIASTSAFFLVPWTATGLASCLNHAHKLQSRKSNPNYQSFVLFHNSQFSYKIRANCANTFDKLGGFHSGVIENSGLWGCDAGSLDLGILKTKATLYFEISDTV